MKKTLACIVCCSLLLAPTAMAQTVGPTGDVGAPDSTTPSVETTVNNNTTNNNNSNNNANTTININGGNINNSNIGSNNTINQTNTVTNITKNTTTVKKYVKVTVDGKPLKSDVQPFINGDNRTVLPLRAIAEAFGATVEWDQTTQTATITLGDKSVKVKIGEKTFEVNGQIFAMDTTAFTKDGRTFLPARAIAEALGLKVGWDQSTGTVTIDPPNSGSGTGNIGTTPTPNTGSDTQPQQPVEDNSWQNKYPLIAADRNDKIDNDDDQHMKSDASLDKNGTLSVTTRTWTDGKTSGFTGGVVVCLLDDQNTIIWTSKQHTFGVDGSWIGNNDRTEKWSESVPLDKLKKGSKLRILHDHAGKNRLIGVIDQIGVNIGQVWPF